MEKIVVYWSTRHFKGKLFVYFDLNELVLLVLRKKFGGIYFYFCTLFQETYLLGFIARHYMILFCCLVMLRKWGKSDRTIRFALECRKTP